MTKENQEEEIDPANADPAAGEGDEGGEGDGDPGDEGGDKGGKGDADPNNQNDPRRKNFNPDPTHPRYKEVYWKMKELEREKEEMAKDIDALRNHSRQTIAQLEEIKKTKADKPAPKAPDPVQEPEAYKAWVEADRIEQEKNFEQKMARQRVETFIEVESSLHEDYDAMAAITEREAAKDPELHKRIWSSNNPARAAYQYGKKKTEEAAKVEKDEKDRQNRIRGTGVEGGGEAAPKGGKGGDKLGDDEVRVIKNLWPDLPYDKAKEKYLANKR